MTHRSLARRCAVALTLAAAATGCRATTATYRFSPSPLEVLVQEQGSGPIVARVLVGIPGAEREGLRSDGYPLLVVRVRVENKSNREVTFDPARSVLVGSDLAEFGAPRSTPVGPLRVAAGDAGSVLLHFPFPQDMRDLDAPLLTGVNLQFELARAGVEGATEISVTLERNEAEVIYDPGPAYTFGPGFYYYGRW